MKNLCGKTRPRQDPYEIWQSKDGSWTWYVLKKYQADDNKPFARWLCYVVSPFVPDGEVGDVYVETVRRDGSIRVK